ncbi:glucose-specific phosphotransferase system IIA component [Streptococcus loxodontisalivarius]|uniref:Glucose-specific phosphotransferase system IIA component n=1 Tax=Streptococcus loxodontisalivarius TaxID=1349415 RepID=A0ABS2PQK6_9STRE|nr:PTS glucose transporter subunit IIA [Streptococcus loxodontisalivarius]MBM7642332.1 glucose-specific phosphotransferase system IIA component [Streptococcus loxodontisalivarius]
MAGGFAGGVVAGLLGARAFVMGYSNPLALPIFGKTAMAAAVGILVTIVVSAIVAYVLGIEESNQEVTEPVQITVADDVIVAVADANLVPLEKVDDPVFSQKLMGDGVAFDLESDFITAPSNGELTTVFPTGHAFGITRKDGVEMLVHIGINTVELNGQGFDVLCKSGETVRAGQPIIRINREEIHQKGYDTTTMLIITNPNDKTIELKTSGSVKQGQELN